jgi:hypothetical protein
LIVALALLAASCQGGAGETTTSDGSSLLTLPPASSTTTTVASPETTRPSFDSLTPPQYQIVQRSAIEGAAGDEVIVLLDPSSYDTLTDIDIENILAEVVELFPPVWIAHLIDDPAAANVVGNPDATTAELEAISDHYLARLDNGFEITFLGPFADAGSGVIGS